jgi:zinc transporter ZupT
MAVKVALMIAFFLEVTIFGNCVSSLACFRNKTVMDLAMTFSGTLFLSIAMIDVIPEAISHFDEFFKERSARFESSSLHQGKLPLTMIIAVITMLIIMYLDKLVMGHSHDHEY